MGGSLQTLRLNADLDTPVSAYLKLSRGESWSFLYESVEGRRTWASYSMIGLGAQRIYRVRNNNLIIEEPGKSAVEHATTDPLATLRKFWCPGPRDPAVPRFVDGIFGFVSYDLIRAYEPISHDSSSPDVDDLLFVEPQLLAVFDNRHHSLTLYSRDPQRLQQAENQLHNAVVPPPVVNEPVTISPLDTRTDYIAHVEKAKEHIRAGDIFQVVLSRRFAITPIAEPFNVYRGLRTINPSPYMFYYHTPNLVIAGASPEVMIRVHDGEVIVRPIAGTRPREDMVSIDTQRERELLADQKERAEHIMLVDLGRNDVGRVSKPGSVQVSQLMTIEHYSHVMHIVSEVRGKLTTDSDAFDALRAAFPAGTLSGAPKVRAMQIIDNFEKRRRGLYGGAIGYFGPGGDADFGIAIRTLVCQNGQCTVQAGAGIVADSSPEKECDETEHKARVVMQAAQWARNLGQTNKP